jgi:molecular chaperone IbpA
VAAPRGADLGRTYLHRGIAQRAFARVFDLADYVVVVGAAMTDGLLTIDLKRELPEALKPRSIVGSLNWHSESTVPCQPCV